MLEVRDIRRRYGRELVLRDVSFTARAGETIGIEGANGAGKSTLIAILAGILAPDSGTVELQGVSFRERGRYQQLIGYVPQQIALFQNLSGRDNLRQWGALRGLSGQALRRAVDEAAALSDIDSFWLKPVRRQSGGMQRRLHLACGLIAKPPLLLLDEPTAGLDRESREHIIQTIERLNQEGLTVIMANHYEDEQSRLARHSFRLEDGVLCALSP